MNVVSVPAAKMRWKRMVRLASSLALLGVLALTQLFGKAWTTAKASAGEWEVVADAFMTAMAAGDTSEAYALFSAEAQRDLPASQLKRANVGSERVHFEGYLDLEITGWYLTYSTGGTYVELSGTVDYDGGHQGAFDAVLKKRGDRWLVHTFNVAAPPEKVAAQS